MIYALTIRSPIANGSLIEIKAPPLPDSYHLITAKNIPGENSLACFPIPVLAEKKLSYIGQPLAILAGPERTVLEELASGLEIITEEKKPVFMEDTAEAAAESADIPVSRKFSSGKSEGIFGENARIVSGN